ncbi:MAG: MATE family efflux transporter [Bacteroidaceae bacterium]|nr:MATE family efflux transporter [Bacteroidaceae bacterium]
MFNILKLAIPSIISTLTVPLMGLLDVVIVGHLADPAFIGAIAVGGMMFSLLYWGFGFLRMGTGGLTAQAFGRGDEKDIRLQLIRPLVIAFAIAVVILLLQRPVEQLITLLIGDNEPTVIHWASVYFRICVWGAPATLSLYALNGWFVGLQRPKLTMYVALIQNIMNLMLSLLFVYGFDMQVEGVAWGTLLAQWIGMFAALFFVWGRGWSRQDVRFHEILDREALLQYFQVNKHIFGRTLCLIAVTVSFTSFGARQGEIMLAVNTLMMQLFTIFSYVMDGFAYAGESLAGAYKGAGHWDELRLCVSRLFRWGWLLTLIFTLLYGLGGTGFLSLLTDQQSVLQAASPFICWAMLIPVCGFSAFLWDGIYIGLTESRLMLITMLGAMLVYLGLYYTLFPFIGNHGLWVAFLCYLFVRGVGQWWFYRRSLLPSGK